MKTPLFTIRLILFCFISINTTFASDFVTEHEIRDISMGSITIGTSSPVSLAGQNELSNRFFAGYRDKFSMKELAVASFGGLCHSPFMTNVLCIASAGYEDYRQTLVGLHAQKQLSEKFSLGVALQSLYVNAITLDKSLWRISPAIGLEYRVNQSLTLGADVNDPVKITLDETNQLQSRLHLTAGASYRIAEMLLLASEYEWTKSEGGNFRAGVEYALISEFKIRAGINSRPFSPSLGCGYTFKNWMLDVAAEQHRYLGTSFSVGLSYLFRN